LYLAQEKEGNEMKVKRAETKPEPDTASVSEALALEVREVLKEEAGLGTEADIESALDKESIEYWVKFHGFNVEDFRAVIQEQMADDDQVAYYLKHPGQLTVRNIFNPRRGDVVLNLRRLADVRKGLEKKRPQNGGKSANTYSKLVRLHKIRLECCGAAFERKTERQEEGRWVWVNREDHEAHVNSCIESGLRARKQITENFDVGGNLTQKEKYHVS